MRVSSRLTRRRRRTGTEAIRKLISFHICSNQSASWRMSYLQAFFVLECKFADSLIHANGQKGLLLFWTHKKSLSTLKYSI